MYADNSIKNFANYMIVHRGVIVDNVNNYCDNTTVNNNVNKSVNNSETIDNNIAKNPNVDTNDFVTVNNSKNKRTLSNSPKTQTPTKRFAVELNNRYEALSQENDLTNNIQIDVDDPVNDPN